MTVPAPEPTLNFIDRYAARYQAILPDVRISTRLCLPELP